MNLPNKLTMLRVILVPVFMVFAALSNYGTAGYNETFMLLAGIVFAAAALRISLTATWRANIIWSRTSASLWTRWPTNGLTTAAFIYMVADGICSPVVLGGDPVPGICGGRRADDRR